MTSTAISDLFTSFTAFPCTEENGAEPAHGSVAERGERKHSWNFPPQPEQLSAN